MNSELTLSADEVARLGCEDGSDVTLSVTGTLVHQPDGSAKIEDPVIEKEDAAEEAAEAGEEESDSEDAPETMGSASSSGAKTPGERLHKNPTIAIILGHGGKMK